jgi:hypothetical protein
MTPEEQSIVDQKLKEVAEILYNNTPDEELNTFETIELSVRDHLLKRVAPKIGELSWCAFPRRVKLIGVAPLFPFSSRNKCRKRENSKKLSGSNNYIKQASHQIEIEKRNSSKSSSGEVLFITGQQ